MEIEQLTTLCRNRIRIEFDDVGERELTLLAKLYVMASVTAAVRPGILPRYIFGFAHDYLCVDGRHEHVKAFEQALLGDLGDMIATQVEKAKAMTENQSGIPPDVQQAIEKIIGAVQGAAGEDVAVRVLKVERVTPEPLPKKGKKK